MPNSHTGAWLGFSTTSTQAVVMKVGISFISIQQAKSNVESETSGNDFDAIHASAVQAWDTALASVSIRDASADSLQQSYTALYHTMLMPVDRTGENPLWSSSEPYYDDFYAIWDTFRSSSPLLTILAEKRQTEIVRALVDIYRHDGWLPDARSGNYNGATQGGSNGDMVIVDAYLKHLPDIDWDTAYKAVINDAENTPLNQIKEGRGDLQDWRNLSYLSIEGVDRPASKHMEYAANDFAIALFAKGMGKSSDEAKYCKRAGNWINLWDGDASANGFRGFIWPRHRNGSWKDGFDPKLQGTWGGDNFYEGNSWTYSTYVPQDVAGLIRASGGNARFVERLDTFFSLPDGYDVGNEPGFLSPYLFVWAGRPDRTQYWIRTILAKSYHSGPTGLPGNDDSGAMSSWYAFGRLGFYPNAAQDEYLIGSPAFQWVQIHLANGKLFTIEALGASPEKPYIQSATWNGKPYERAWFTHEQLMQGGTLRFVMSSKPSSWALSEPPPSISTGSCDHKP
jgi:predicted alpha-1,2-mannosidase